MGLLSRAATTLGLLTAAGLLAVPATALAQSPPPGGQGVSVIPAPGERTASGSGTHLELGTLTPGVAATVKVVVRDVGPKPLSVWVYAADAVPAYGGGFGFSARGAAAREVGSWAALPVQRLDLAPDSALVVPVIVTAPGGLAGGEYVGGVVAEPVDADPAAPGVHSATRFAMAVYLTLPGGPGATPGRGRPDGSLTVTRLTTGRGRDGSVCPVVSYRNDSQLVLDPASDIRVHSPLGGTVTLHRDRTGAVLPDQTAVVPLGCFAKDKIPLGPDTLDLRLSSPRGTSSGTAHFANLPFVVVGAGLFLLLLLLVLLWLLLRRRRREDEPGPAAVVAADRSPAVV